MSFTEDLFNAIQTINRAAQNVDDIAEIAASSNPEGVHDELASSLVTLNQAYAYLTAKSAPAEPQPVAPPVTPDPASTSAPQEKPFINPEEPEGTMSSGNS